MKLKKVIFSIFFVMSMAHICNLYAGEGVEESGTYHDPELESKKNDAPTEGWMSWITRRSKEASQKTVDTVKQTSTKALETTKKAASAATAHGIRLGKAAGQTARNAWEALGEVSDDQMGTTTPEENLEHERTTTEETGLPEKPSQSTETSEPEKEKSDEPALAPKPTVHASSVHAASVKPAIKIDFSDHNFVQKIDQMTDAEFEQFMKDNPDLLKSQMKELYNAISKREQERVDAGNAPSTVLASIDPASGMKNVKSRLGKAQPFRNELSPNRKNPDDKTMNVGEALSGKRSNKSVKNMLLYYFDKAKNSLAKFRPSKADKSVSSETTTEPVSSGSDSSAKAPKDESGWFAGTKKRWADWKKTAAEKTAQTASYSIEGIVKRVQASLPKPKYDIEQNTEKLLTIIQRQEQIRVNNASKQDVLYLKHTLNRQKGLDAHAQRAVSRSEFKSRKVDDLAIENRVLAYFNEFIEEEKKKTN